VLHPECAQWFNKPLQNEAAGLGALQERRPGPKARVFTLLGGDISEAVGAYRWAIKLDVHAEDVARTAVSGPDEVWLLLCEILKLRPWRQKFKYDEVMQLVKAMEKLSPKVEDRIRKCFSSIPHGLAGA